MIQDQHQLALSTYKEIQMSLGIAAAKLKLYLDIYLIFCCLRFLKYCSSEDPARSLILLILATCLANEGDMAASSGVLFQWCIEVLDISDSDVTKVTQQLKSSPKQFFLNPK